MGSAVKRIAAVAGSDGIAALLASAVIGWRSEGARIVGVIGELHGLPDRTCGAGFLRDIALGTAYRIYLETAPGHTSCHLDAEGVAKACVAICGQIPASDLVVLNKFGSWKRWVRGWRRPLNLRSATASRC